MCPILPRRRGPTATIGVVYTTAAVGVVHLVSNVDNEKNSTGHSADGTLRTPGCDVGQLLFTGP